MNDTSEEKRAPDPPRVEEVEDRLGLGAEDREELPGLHRLNTVQIPLARFMAFTLALLVVPVHNQAVLGSFDLSRYLTLVFAVEAYCLLSWLVLRQWFARAPGLHLGTVFVVTDLLFLSWLVHFTGGPRSLFWPVYFIRVADQIWISQTRALVMTVLSVLLYGSMALAWNAAGVPLEPGTEAVKVIALGGMSLALAMVARQPWNVRGRTLEARDLILRLEADSRALDEERRRAERASQAMSEFLARMSHELRAPLNSVVGFTNVLLKHEGRPLGTREVTYLRRIRRNGLHLLGTANDLLDLARLERGRVDVQLSETDLGAVVRDVVGQLQGRTFEGTLTLAASVPPGVATIRADESRLRQVLVNLVGAAIKVSEAGRVRVSVCVGPDGRTPTAVEIEHAGDPVAGERIPTLFDAFDDEQPGAEPDSGSVALGLAISRSLCEVMGYELNARRRSDDRSVLTLVLGPAEEPDLSPPARRPA